jgi:hypothetical protein
MQEEMLKHQANQALVQVPKDKANVIQVQVVVVVHMSQATKVNIIDLMYRLSLLITPNNLHVFAPLLVYELYILSSLAISNSL